MTPTLTLSEALARAALEGVECRIMAGLTARSRVVRVSVATSDRNPMLTLALGDGREELLREREQSAPDRWDYLAKSGELAGRHFLRLRRGELSADIEILGAARTIIETHGWTDDESLVAEAIVEMAAFDGALAQLIEGRA